MCAKKHNWFRVKGDFRANENLTTKEFLKLLESLGLELSLGSVGYSELSDSDFDSPTMSGEFTVEDIHKIKEQNYVNTNDITATELIEKTRQDAEKVKAELAYLRENRSPTQSERKTVINNAVNKTFAEYGDVFEKLSKD